MATPGDGGWSFAEAAEGLRRGDFSRLAPLFEPQLDGVPPMVIVWHQQGRFADQPEALAEALTCACFLGRTTVAAYLLDQGVDPTAGDRTGLAALHWAVNRGQFETASLLLQWGVPLETRNMYGGTMLGTAVWSALHEPRPRHPDIIAALLQAGARVDAVDFPTGRPDLDALLRPYLGA